MRKIILIFVLIFLLCACTTGNQSFTENADIQQELILGSGGETADITCEEILSRYNNEAPSEELIKYGYPEEALVKWLYKSDEQNYRLDYRLGYTLLDYAKEFKIECVRKLTDEQYYVILKSDQANKFITLFEKKEDNWIAKEALYFKSDLRAEQFNEIVPGKSTYSDVEALDPHNYFIMSSGVPIHSSQHFTADGVLININYQKTEGNDINRIKELLRVEGLFSVDLDNLEKEGLNLVFYQKLLSLDKIH